MFCQNAIVVLVQLFSQWCSVKTGGDWIFLTDNIPGNYRCRGPPTEIISVLKSGCKSLLTRKKKSRLTTIVYKCLIWCNIVKFHTPWCIIKAQWGALLALVILRLGTARRKKENMECEEKQRKIQSPWNGIRWETIQFHWTQQNNLGCGDAT